MNFWRWGFLTIRSGAIIHIAESLELNFHGELCFASPVLLRRRNRHVIESHLALLFACFWKSPRLLLRVLLAVSSQVFFLHDKVNRSSLSTEEVGLFDMYAVLLVPM